MNDTALEVKIENKAEMLHVDEVARLKSKAGLDWVAFRWERIGPDATLVQGGVPRIIKAVKKAGRCAWDKDKCTEPVIVTDAEWQAQEKRYETDTGNCGKCLGLGKVPWRWKAATRGQCGRQRHGPKGAAPAASH